MSLHQQRLPDALVTFDEFSKLRVLDSQQYEESEKLRDECKDFVLKIDEFNSLVASFLDILGERASFIEKEKLKAIGARNAVEKEVENRKIKQQELASLIRERQSEFERLTVHSDSLSKNLQEQQNLIESLSSK